MGRVSYSRHSVIILYGAVILLTCVVSSTTYDDLTITQSQKAALDKFKSGMAPIVPKPYMKEEIYLIRWLRAKNFDVAEAEAFLKEHLKWWRDNDIDKILEEDFSDVVNDYPAQVDTYAKNGAPVITAMAGQWNLRKAYLTGQYGRLNRMVYMLMEKASNDIREQQRQGKNVTRFYFLLNLDGFNIIQHGCPRCVWTIVTMLQAYENHFPGMTDKIIIFNAIPAVQAMRPALRGAITGRTRGNIKLFGTNKAEWLPELLKIVDADQLTVDFGGNRVRKE